MGCRGLAVIGIFSPTAVDFHDNITTTVKHHDTAVALPLDCYGLSWHCHGFVMARDGLS